MCVSHQGFNQNRTDGIMVTVSTMFEVNQPAGFYVNVRNRLTNQKSSNGGDSEGCDQKFIWTMKSVDKLQHMSSKCKIHCFTALWVAELFGIVMIR